jgi:hypothetical protein
MEMMTKNQDISSLRFFEAACPYNGIHTCMASLSSMTIDEYQRERWCSTDDYDSCPIFLAKVLRRS